MENVEYFHEKCSHCYLKYDCSFNRCDVYDFFSHCHINIMQYYYLLFGRRVKYQDNGIEFKSRNFYSV